MPPTDYDRYVCSLSGSSEPVLDEDAAALVGADDDLDDLPVGWGRVSIEVRVENPDWHLLQAARHGLVHESVQQMGDSPQNRRLAEILVDGQLAGALDSTPRFVTAREEFHVAPAYLGHARTALGVEDEDSVTPEPAPAPVVEPEPAAPAIEPTPEAEAPAAAT